MRHLLHLIIDYLFPIECLICHQYGPDICDTCVSLFKWPKPQKQKWITSLWNYRDLHTEMVMRHIKNQPNKRIALIISLLLSERIVNRPAHPDDWIIIPIPISKKRFRERGYNQSELLAQPIAERFGFSMVSDVLIKSFHTNKQGTSASREDRLINVIGAFSIKNAEKIKNKNIILVDDIITTGATLSEARLILLQSGAKRVIAWTVAN